MDKYIVREYDQPQLSLLKEKWLLLERGKDMSFFQSYDWYESINNVIPSKGKVVFFEVLNNEKTILIAPLWILKHTHLIVNKYGCYFWGRGGYSDYLNFIYSEFDGAALIALFNCIQQQYGMDRYFLEFLQKDTDVVSFIERYIPKIQKVSFPYAVINLPDDVDEYVSKLSKHSRQNIRTAHNRMVKDGVIFECKIIERCTDKDLRAKCDSIRLERLPNKMKEEEKNWSLKTRIHMFLYRRMIIKFPFGSVLEVEKNGNLLLITCEDEVAAFFYFGYDLQKKRVVVMTAGTNMKYSRYSPGFYFMYQQIREWIDCGSVKFVDFTRGNEKYKYDLGCEKKPVYNLTFQYKNDC